MTLTRRLALDIVLGVERGFRGPRSARASLLGVREALDLALQRHRLSARDSGLLTELVYGTVRHHGTLEAIAAKFSKPALSRLDPLVRTALELGMYQILCLDRVPDSAAVHETVESVKVKGGRRSASFVNGVLRAVCRELDARAVSALAPADRRRAVSRPDGQFALFKSDWLPDPATHPSEWVARVYSMPTWLANRWIDRLGLEDTEKLCAAQNRPPRLFLRTNLLRTDPAALAARLRGDGLDPRQAEGCRPECIDLGGRAAIGKVMPALGEGLCTVQDPTAMDAAPQVAPAAGDRVLEVCAAPGGKTTHLAELAHDAATIFAMDSSHTGALKVAANAQRLGLRGIHTLCADGTRPPLLGPFDKVLLDAACSNTGVLARRVEARWRLRESDLARLAALQLDLLEAAGALARPGGSVVYSTCSTEPEENQHVVQAFVKRLPQFELVHEKEFLPHRVPGDGGYVAKLTRR